MSPWTTNLSPSQDHHPWLHCIVACHWKHSSDGGSLKCYNSSDDDDDYVHYNYSTLKINHQMSSSNDELLYEAARDGDLVKVKELLSKGTGTAG